MWPLCRVGSFTRYMSQNHGINMCFAGDGVGKKEKKLYSDAPPSSTFSARPGALKTGPFSGSPMQEPTVVKLPMSSFRSGSFIFQLGNQGLGSSPHLRPALRCCQYREIVKCYPVISVAYFINQSGEKKDIFCLLADRAPSYARH